MVYPSNTLTLPSTLPPGPVAPSAGNWGASSTSTGPRVPPDVITYSFGPRMVYVTPGETYDHAIDIAKQSFAELKDVERERIGLEVSVLVKNQNTRRTAEIGRTAWSVVVASLSRFEIVEIHVAPAPNPKAAEAFSSSQSSSVGPPPYPSENASSWCSDSRSTLAPQSSSSSFATRVVDLLTHKSSRSHLSQSHHRF